MKPQTKVFLVAVGIFILCLFLAKQYKSTASTPATTGNTSVAVCPHILAQNDKYTITASECSPEKSTDGTVLPNLYIAKKYTVASLDGTVQQIFPVSEEFTTADPSMMEIGKDSNDDYVIYTGGTWLIHGATIFSMKDARMVSISFGQFLRTDTGYILYSVPSKQYPNAHPEVDLSAAMDVNGLRLSDFSLRTLCMGDTKYNCRIGNVNANGISVAIEKVLWNSSPEKVIPVRNFPFK
jgi:hypothetical protein